MFMRGMNATYLFYYTWRSRMFLERVHLPINVARRTRTPSILLVQREFTSTFTEQVILLKQTTFVSSPAYITYLIVILYEYVYETNKEYLDILLHLA